MEHLADTSLNDKQVIEEFLRQHQPSLSIDRTPDVENQDTNTSDSGTEREHVGSRIESGVEALPPTPCYTRHPMHRVPSPGGI